MLSPILSFHVNSKMNIQQNVSFKNNLVPKTASDNFSSVVPEKSVSELIAQLKDLAKKTKFDKSEEYSEEALNKIIAEVPDEEKVSGLEHAIAFLRLVIKFQDD